MLLYDTGTHDPQLAQIRDAAGGEVLDAMVGRERSTKRFFASDCRVLKADLRPMGSAVMASATCRDGSTLSATRPAIA